MILRLATGDAGARRVGTYQDNPRSFATSASSGPITRSFEINEQLGPILVGVDLRNQGYASKSRTCPVPSAPRR